MALQCELEGSAITVVGDFNPALFQPFWFAKFNLLAEEEAAAAEIEIVRPEITAFVAGGFRVHVQRNRFQVEITDPSLGFPLRDLVLGTCRLMEHVPLRQLGFNGQFHFRLDNVDDWNTVGHALAPKSLWQGLVEKPGTTDVTIRGFRTGSRAAHLNVSVQPSTRVQHGVYVGTNEHYEISEGEDERGLLDVIEKDWEDAQRAAREIAEQIVRRARDTK